MVNYRRYRRKRKNKYNDKVLFYIFFIGLILFVYFIFSRFKLNHINLDISLENVAALKISSSVMIELSELAETYGIDFSEILTVYCLENNFFEEKILDIENFEKDFLINFKEIKEAYDEDDFLLYYNLINNIIEEIKNFPIDISEKGKYIYGDSWGAERTYGGNRIHQGTDIMDKENVEGNIAIISMTDGVVEKLGWNEKGGYRVGIRTDNGNYYYYAHLNEFAQGLQEGSLITAGQLLGYMGNTGYSKVEGTKGNFEVHLHLGIEVISALSKEPFWINPYPFLSYIEYLES